MNIPQKILTILFLLLFVCGTIIAVSNGGNQLQDCLIAWVVLGVVYAGFFFLFASKKRS